MANAGGTTSSHDTGPTSKALQRPQGIGEMRVRAPPWECSLRTAVSPLFVATGQQSHHGECRPDYMVCNTPGRGFESRPGRHYGRVAQLDRAGNVRSTPRRREPNSGWQMPVRLHRERSKGRAVRIRASVSPPLVASTMIYRRMPAGLQVRAPASGQEVGGPTPPPGNRIAQGNVSPNLVPGTDKAERGECRWDYITPEKPVRFRPVRCGASPLDCRLKGQDAGTVSLSPRRHDPKSL